MKKTKKKTLVTVEALIHEQGSRPHMEDSHSITENESWVVFAIFDGHGGDAISRQLADPESGLGRYLLDRLKDKPDKNVAATLKRLFQSYDDDLLKRFGSVDVGSTACLCLVWKGTYRHLWICNVGDSRATLMDAKTGRLKFMTLDHKPNLKSEKQRIEAAGGAVTLESKDVPRINRMTAVSRAFGDFHLKKAEGELMSCLPCVHSLELLPEEEVYLLLGTDGIWDELSIARLTTFINKFPHSFARKIVNWILETQPACDNITLLALTFSSSK